MQTILEDFKESMPWFVYRVEVTNSKHHGLPHNRPRVFLIGYHRHLVPSVPGLDQPLFQPMVVPSLWKLLAKGCAKLDVEKHLTKKERDCVVNGYLPLLHEHLWNRDLLGKVAVFDISRNPKKKFGAFLRCDDLVGTLTCANAGLVVISLGEGMEDCDGDEGTVPDTTPGSAPQIFRFLFTEERLRCHGFPNGADFGLSAAQSVKASGNAFSVNAVGRIIAPFVKALIDTNALWEIPLVKPAASAPTHGQKNLKAWMKKSRDPWREISPEQFADEGRFERFCKKTSTEAYNEAIPAVYVPAHNQAECIYSHNYVSKRGSYVLGSDSDDSECPLDDADSEESCFVIDDDDSSESATPRKKLKT